MEAKKLMAHTMKLLALNGGKLPELIPHDFISSLTTFWLDRNR